MPSLVLAGSDPGGREAAPEIAAGSGSGAGGVSGGFGVRAGLRGFPASGCMLFGVFVGVQGFYSWGVWGLGPGTWGLWCLGW